jgi:hypothetical protein
MILFVATDAGGAKELIPVIREAFAQGQLLHVLSSPVTEPLFASAAVESEARMITSEKEAMEFLSSKKIDALIVGTTGTIKSERYLTAATKKMNIRSTAVVDEWYNFALRFQDEDGAIGKYLPDAICVPDETASKFAMEENIPENILHITGSPALAEIAERSQIYHTNPPPVPSLLQDVNDTISVLFLSEAIARGYGSAPGEHGTHGPYVGFQENIVREDLAELLEKSHKKILVLEKLHPSEGEKMHPSSVKTIEWKILSGADPVEPLLWHADVIIGMCSKALVEAKILGRSPISYQPGAADPKKYTAVRIGAAELFMSKEELAKKLPTILTKKKVQSGEWKFAAADTKAAETILGLSR